MKFERIREEAGGESGGGGVAIASEAPPPVADPPSNPDPTAPPAGGTGDFDFTLTGDKGDFPEGWLDNVGSEFDSMRSNLQKFKSVADLGTSYTELQRAYSEKTDGMIKIPGADAPAEEITAFDEARGVPATAEEYEITPPETMPEGVEFNADNVTGLKEWAKAQGFTNAQLQAAAELQIQIKGQEMAHEAEAKKIELAQWDQTLHDTWGAGYAEKSAMALRGAATFGFDPEHPGFKDPAIQTLLVNAASAIAPTKLVEAETVSGSMSKHNQAKDIVSNPSNRLHDAFHSASHRDHEAAKAEHQRLMKEAYPE